MNKIARYSASAQMYLSDGGVLLIKVRGPVTLDALRSFKAGIVQAHAAQIRAFVVDYSEAAVLLTSAELDAVLEDEGAGSAPAMPAAMIVRDEELEIFRAHAVRQAFRGVLRQIFRTDEARQALHWARRHGEIAAARRL